MPKHPQPTDQNVIADAGADNWVDRQAPDWFKPYLKLGRFDRPIGSWLLLWPCWWSLALVASETSVFRWPTAPAPGWPDPLLIAFNTIASFPIRSILLICESRFILTQGQFNLAAT